MKIHKIYLKNFTSIKKMELELTNINVLIGPNGAGKSNFISFLKLLNKIIDSDLQSYVAEKGGADNLLFFGRKNSHQIETNIDFEPNHYLCELKPTNENSLYFAKEVLYFDTPDKYGEVLGSGHTETKIFDRMKKHPHTKNVAWHVAEALKSWKVYHFHDTSSSAKVKSTSDIDDNRVLRPDASNLAAFLYKLEQKNPEYFRQIESTIKLIAPFFDRFKLEPLELKESKIRIEWKHIGSDQYFNAHSLSDGTIRMICLITLLLQPKPPETIIIDEPELGLHPSAITLLASLIKSASISTQIIISTQSVTLIDHFAPQDIVVVERENNESTFRRLDAKELEDWREFYSMGEIWEKNIIGGRP